MNIFLWVLQILLALHTAMGAIWKFSNSEQVVPSLRVIPHGVWMLVSAFELILSAVLIASAFNKRFARLVAPAAGAIALEMLIFCGIHLFSKEIDNGPMIYWLVVAIICGFISYGRFVLKPV